MLLNAPRSTAAWTVVLFALLMSGCATLPPDAQPNPADPWERMNRGTHRFNDRIDRAVLKPVATAYRDHVPQFVRTGVDNALENLGTPTVIVNDLLQGKLVEGLSDTGRFLLNSTFGIGGLLDPASRAGLDKHDEDFGQTLGRWGVPSGPYLVIPLMGPSTVRDTPTRYVDARTRADELLDDEVSLFREDAYEIGIGVVGVVNTRAALLELDELRAEAFDDYAFVRDAWLQRREYMVTDGEVEEEEESDTTEAEGTGAEGTAAEEAAGAEPTGAEPAAPQAEPAVDEPGESPPEAQPPPK
jgi:phospholipid-binding lipoprotein MlaA